MRAQYLITSTVFASLLVAGCGSKQKTRATAQPGRAGAPAAAKTVAPRTEPATGAVREALLHLRRVHFSFDSAALLPETRTALAEAAERLRANPNVHIYIDGHTDERGTGEYNLALGDQRARAVADYLTHMGIAPERLHIVTFGEEKPSMGGRNEVAYAKNRRAEFRLFRGGVRLVVDDGVLYNDRGKRIAKTNF